MTIETWPDPIWTMSRSVYPLEDAVVLTLHRDALRQMEADGQATIGEGTFTILTNPHALAYPEATYAVVAIALSGFITGRFCPAGLPPVTWE